MPPSPLNCHHTYHSLKYKCNYNSTSTSTTSTSTSLLYSGTTWCTWWDFAQDRTTWGLSWEPCGAVRNFLLGVLCEACVWVGSNLFHSSNHNRHRHLANFLTTSTYTATATSTTLPQPTTPGFVRALRGALPGVSAASHYMEPLVGTIWGDSLSLVWCLCGACALPSIPHPTFCCTDETAIPHRLEGPHHLPGWCSSFQR